MKTKRKMISEQDFSRAWRFLALPSVVAFFILVWLNRSFDDAPLWRVWSVHIALFFTLAFAGTKKFSHNTRNVYLVNVLAGFSFAFAFAIASLFADFSFPKLFTVITEPAYAAIAGMLVAWAVVSLERSTFRLTALFGQGRKMLRWKG